MARCWSSYTVNQEKRCISQKSQKDITPEDHSGTSEVTLKVHLGVSVFIIAEMLHRGEDPSLNEKSLAMQGSCGGERGI